MKQNLSNVLLILPTYNEATNIKPIINQAFNAFYAINGFTLSVLVVDDNSPDGTAKIVRKLQNSNKNIHLISSMRRGLGKAYVRGLRYGLRRSRYGILVMMDADFSHNPKSIPSLVKEVEKGADYVIGSRYVTGGNIKNWPLRRKITSLSANFLAKVFLDTKSDVRDLTGGFKAIRASTLKSIGLANFNASGYVFQVNLFYEFAKQGRIIAEVPIEFTNRVSGKSKLRIRDVLEFATLTYKLNPDSRIRKFIRFGLVGACGSIINLTVLFMLVNFVGLPVLLSAAIAIESSIVFNFILNNAYTFRSTDHFGKPANKSSENTLLQKILKYNLISLGGAAISFIIFAVCFQSFGINYLVSATIAIALAMGWNYWMSVNIVWKLVDD